MRMNPATGLGSVAHAPFTWTSGLLILCVAAALLSALLVRAMIRVGVLDRPGHRSAHARPTPKGGGVGVMAAWLGFVPVALSLHGGALPIRAAGGLLGGAGLLALVAWLDDLRQFRPALKLLAQIAASGLVIAALWPLPWHPVLAATIGFGWLVFVTNAINFIDGLNGLASGSVGIAALWIGLTGAATGAEAGADALEQASGCILAAALAGFLPFNWPKARIFLGDVGSQGAGLAIAALGLLHWQHAGMAGRLDGMLAMPLLLSGILADVGFTLCRRLLQGERLTEAHRGHLYQLAFRSAVPARTIAILHWGFAAWGGALAWSLADGRISPPDAVLLALLVQLAWAATVIGRARSHSIGRW